MNTPMVTLDGNYWIATCDACGWAAARVYRAAADGAAVVHAQECQEAER